MTVPAPNPGRTRLTATIVACALLMQNLDGTVVATALPAMAKSFGAAPLEMNLALTSYLLSLAVFIPVSGWMADRYGSRTVFRAAIAVFTLGSILCGYSSSLAMLVFSRIVQGLGGAMMVPVGRLVLLRSVAKSELVAAMAWLTVPALIGPVIGPPLGGFLVTYANWRWIFTINVPIGLLGILLVSLFVDELKADKPGRLDGWGLVLAGVALSGITFGSEMLGRGVAAAWAVAACLWTGLVAGAGYFWHARRRPDPLLDLTLLKIPTFAVSVLAGTLFRIGVGAIPFLLPLMFQIGFGDSAAQSGTVTFASAIGAVIMKPAAQRALRAFGFRATLLWNAVASAVGVALCAAFRTWWPLAAIYAALIVGGFFRSLQFTAYNTIAYADIPRARMSAATSLYATIQQLSLTFGVTIGTTALAAASHFYGRSTLQVSDFAFAFLVVAFLMMLAAPASLLMPADAGAEVSGHHHRVGDAGDGASGR
ncbi:MAG: MFS transporter [Acetobacteraceae bacterium]|nr:MFS transporter [Acetobacteraceae bacterium]